jgi:hypothetical protein
MYRYVLWREWDMFNHHYLMVLGLNPSTADEHHDDPTIRRCIGYAKQWGYGALCMTNLFAYRSTDPQELYGMESPVGPENDRHITAVATEANMILAAWGTHGRYQDRDRHVMALLTQTCQVMSLGTNKDGTPKHPLYVAKKQKPLPYGWTQVQLQRIQVGVEWIDLEEPSPGRGHAQNIIPAKARK